MGSGSVAVRRQSGAISTVLVALAGFAAGAFLMGLVAFVRQPAPIVGDTGRAPTSKAPARDAVSTPMMIEPGRPWPSPAEPFPWPFESATPASAPTPGKKRPDRLSAPEGWTYEAGGQAN
jgi:hypothetical protein